MMRSGYNQVSPNQEQYPQSMPEYWGGYQQPMPYPQPSNHNLEQPFMYPYHPQDKGGYMTPYHDPYQQAAYHPFQPVQQQAMPVGAFSGQQCNAANGSKPCSQSSQSTAVQSAEQAQAFSPFDNPLQPAKRPPQSQQQAHNPYPKQQFMQKPQPSGIQIGHESIQNTRWLHGYNENDEYSWTNDEYSLSSIFNGQRSRGLLQSLDGE